PDRVDRRGRSRVCPVAAQGVHRPIADRDLLLLSALQAPPRATLFPYTTLFRSADVDELLDLSPLRAQLEALAGGINAQLRGPRADRKSTRLNSSHVEISYAVFCLKKKTAQGGHRPIADRELLARAAPEARLRAV